MNFQLNSKNESSLPISRILLLILFSIYLILPEDPFGKIYVNNLAYGYLAGAFALALPAFVIFFPIIIFGSSLMTKKNPYDPNPNIDFESQSLQKLFHFAFYICILGSIGILIYYTLRYQESDQYIWFTSTVAIIEIIQFMFRGSSQDKAKFYLIHLLSSVVLYGSFIFISLNEVDSLTHTPNESYYLPLSIAHLLIGLILDSTVIKGSFNKN